MTDIRKNQNYIIDITGMTHEGQGVGRIDGFTVFVDGVLENEQVEIKIIKVNKSFAIGKLVNIIKLSENRTQPFCESYKHCGGCSLQHLNYEAQLEFKKSLVKENIKRIGKLEGVSIHDTIGMEHPKNYRNKAQYPVAMVGGSIVSGFYAKRSHNVIENNECGIQDEASNTAREIIIEFANRKNITIYNEETCKGLLRHIMTRVGFKTGEIMVVIVINGGSFPYINELVEILIEKVPAIKSVYLNINTKNTNIILGDKNKKVYGNDAIFDYIGKYKYRISPLSFFQVNPIQTEVLYSKALEYAGLTGNETVFDLYCGIGTISLFLSKKASKVYGVEVIEDAVKDARKNAELNGVTNVEFITGEAEVVIPEMYKQGIRADVVVVDPPRKGCDEALLKTLVDMAPDRIVYVSCNPSTLARDLGYLAGNGFVVAEVQPVDMFPWTGHVECVILLQNEIQ